MKECIVYCDNSYCKHNIIRDGYNVCNNKSVRDRYGGLASAYRSSCTYSTSGKSVESEVEVNPDDIIEFSE